MCLHTVEKIRHAIINIEVQLRAIERNSSIVNPNIKAIRYNMAQIENEIYNYCDKEINAKYKTTKKVNRIRK